MAARGSSVFICPVCEVENRGDAKFCRKCGQSLAAPDQHAAVPIKGSPADVDVGMADVQLPPGNGQQTPHDFSAPECPACWTALRVSDKFCCWCGHPQPLRSLPPKKICVQCATVLPDKANFCYSCGSAVVGLTSRKVRFPEELFQQDDPELFPRFDA